MWSRLGSGRAALIPFLTMTLRSALKFAAGVALGVGCSGCSGDGARTDLWSSKPALAVGGRGAAFNLPGSDGKTYRLAEFKGASAVVLAWFPKASPADERPNASRS